MRHDNLTTEQVIEILRMDGVIYWTEEAYSRLLDGIDWDRVAKELGTKEIHTFCQGYKTRVIYPDK